MEIPVTPHFSSVFFSVCVNLRAGPAHTKPLNVLCCGGLTPHRSFFICAWLCLHFTARDWGRDGILYESQPHIGWTSGRVAACEGDLHITLPRHDSFIFDDGSFTQ